MSIIKVAEFIIWRHKLANNSVRLEESVRNDISSLWNIPNKLFNVLSVCAEADPKKTKTPNEMRAKEGAKFCKQLLAMVNYLKANQETIDLPTMQQVLKKIVELISFHKDAKFGPDGKISEEGESNKVQFPHVSEVIFEMMPSSTTHSRAQRDQQYGKARTGLSRILSFSLSMLEKLSKLELMVPEKFVNAEDDESGVLPGRFSPQRAPLSVYDIIDFIRQHGDEYGLSSTEDWEVVFRDDPEFREDMTTIINAINRGRYPLGSADVKMEIARVIRDYEERKSTNANLFESEPEVNEPDDSDVMPIGTFRKYPSPSKPESGQQLGLFNRKV